MKNPNARQNKASDIHADYVVESGRGKEEIMSAIFSDFDIAEMQDAANGIGNCAGMMNSLFEADSVMQRFIREYYPNANIRVIWPGNRKNSVELVVVKDARNSYTVWAADGNRTIAIHCEKIRDGFNKALSFIITGEW